MKSHTEQTDTVDDYIAQYPEEIQKRLNELRELIKKTIPKAIEDISYQMPAYRAEPGKRPFAFFGVASDHIGVYALHFDISPKLAKKVEPFLTSKSTFQINHDQPLPLDLIKEMLLEKKVEYDL